MTIRRVERGEDPRRGLIAIAGPSSSGKTFSALRVATGIRDTLQNGAIAMLDTELRGNLYENRFEFDRYVMDPPFNPEAWLEAFRQLDSKYSVIVSDSFSDLHEGTGGLCEIADSSPLKNEAARWANPKSRNKTLMGAVRRLKSQHLFLLRALDSVKITDGVDRHGNKKRVIETPGWRPVAEKNFKYDVSLGWMLPPDSKGRGAIWKEFEDLTFNDGDQLSEAHGTQIARWIKGETITSTGGQQAVMTLVTICEADGGTRCTTSIWQEGVEAYQQVKAAARGIGPEAVEAVQQANAAALMVLQKYAPGPKARASLQAEIEAVRELVP